MSASAQRLPAPEPETGFDPIRDLDPIDCEGWTLVKQLPDGRWCATKPLIYHWTLLVDIHQTGYEDRYCYRDRAGAEKALADWDGTGDPEGWHRHVGSHRRQDLATGKIWVEP